VAQVYKGYIKGRAEPVAIKVLHPHINESVGADLDVLRSIAAFFESFPKLKPLGPVAIVDDFRLRMVEQLDLRNEASHLRRFIKNFENDSDVEFPYPIDEYVHEKVLVESFLTDARPILEYTGCDEETKRRLADIGLKAVMKMLLLDNLVHGDLHPGNVMVTKKKYAAAPEAKAQAASSWLHWLGLGGGGRRRRRWRRVDCGGGRAGLSVLRRGARDRDGRGGP